MFLYVIKLFGILHITTLYMVLYDMMTTLWKSSAYYHTAYARYGVTYSTGAL